VSAGFLEQSPYQIEAEFDGRNDITLCLNGGERIKRAWAVQAPLRCGPVRVRLFAFDLETEALARIGPRLEVRAWLREWSGISVYRDGFRIWPYGEPHDDWLRLDQRRVNNPMVRLSNNQVVGFVEVSADRNQEIRDQTSREGLIHNEAFVDLQRFVLHAMQVLEAERQTQRHPDGKRSGRKQSMRRVVDEPDGVTEALVRLAKQADGALGDELQRAAQRVRAQLETREQAYRRALDGYCDLAAIGHTSSLLGRSLTAELASVRELVSGIRSSLIRRGRANPTEIASRVAELELMLESVSRQAHVVATAGSGSARRRRSIDVPAELFRVRDGLRTVLEQEQATLEVDAPAGMVLRTEMRPETFTSIISTLVRNSLEWRRDDRPLEMVLVVREADEDLEVLFSDNGKGVPGSLEDKLFDPGVSGHDAAGMGLTIARNVVLSHAGTISLVTDKRRKGATLRIQLPRKRSRATSPRSA
jgi:hypothetical protein